MKQPILSALHGALLIAIGATSRAADFHTAPVLSNKTLSPLRVQEVKFLAKGMDSHRPNTMGYADDSSHRRRNPPAWRGPQRR